MFRHLLVPTDGSDLSRHTAAKAIDTTLYAYTGTYSNQPWGGETAITGASRSLSSCCTTIATASAGSTSSFTSASPENTANITSTEPAMTRTSEPASERLTGSPYTFCENSFARPSGSVLSPGMR